jgi:hypothetical protein
VGYYQDGKRHYETFGNANTVPAAIASMAPADKRDFVTGVMDAALHDFFDGTEIVVRTLPYDLRPGAMTAIREAVTAYIKNMGGAT